MEDKKSIVESLENLLDMFPENLTEEEKNKVEEIREMLKKLK